MENGKCIAIVDGFSTGQFFAPRLRAKGFSCVHVQNGVDISEYILHYYRPEHYIGNIIYNGNLPSVVDQLKKLNVNKVIVGCESGVELADSLSEALELPSNGTARSEARRNKFLMQEALKKSGVRTMAYQHVNNIDSLQEWIRSLGTWPVVIKPVKSAGTEGVILCNSEEEVIQNFNKLIGAKNFFGDINKEVIVEECLWGTEYAVNTVSWEGKHFLSDIWEYRKIRVPGSAPIYDYAKLIPYPSGALESIIDYTFQALNALGIKYGPAHNEVMMTEKGPFLIEMGARVMGASFPPDLISECIGRNQVDLVISAYNDHEQFFKLTERPYQLKKHLLAKFAISHQKGKVKAIPELELCRHLPSFYSANFGIEVGGFIQPTIDLFTSPAEILFKHENEDIVMADYQTIYDLEDEAADQLFEIEHPPEVTKRKPGSEWFKEIPDEVWLKPEKEAEKDADLICRCLNLKKGETILDAPCGDGRVAVHVAKRGVHITGIDINERFIEKARSRFSSSGLGGEFLRLDLRHIDFENRFDAVYNWFNSFGYFTVEEDLDALKRLARALKPGGRFLLESPNKKHILNNVRKKEGNIRFIPHWDPKTDTLDEDIIVKLHPSKIQDIHAKARNTAGCEELTFNPAKGGIKNRHSEKHYTAHIRIYSLGQYKLLFRLAGLQVEAVHDENGDLFHPHSRRVIIIGKKR